MKTILVIAERSQQPQLALAKALSFSRVDDVEIHVAVVCYEELDWLGAVHERQTAEQLQQDILNAERLWWKDYLSAECANTKVTHEIVWQKYLADWVLKHCESRAYDLIIKRGHRTEAAFYIPTDWVLLRDSKVPIYLVSDEHHQETKVVLVALDLMAKSEEKRQLNRQLMEAGFRLSVITASALHCCYVIKIPEVLKDLDLIDVQGHCQKLEVEARKNGAALFECYDLDSDHVHIRNGVPWKVISALSQKLKANCIVIGTMGRKGLAGKFFGNTSERVIHVARKDLLVLGQH